jgi:glycosyltransferase involved in cell wall biosynthesis
VKLSIIIPAYNEEKRIASTLNVYYDFFHDLLEKKVLDFELLVVLNGCKDNTYEVVKNIRHHKSHIHILDLKQAGKGLAIKAGFINALQRPNHLIGFVDADMATRPEYFYDLVTNIGSADGIIASRYMLGAKVTPPRPWIKRWGSRIFYESLVRLLFGINYYDFQCGAKLFKRHVIEAIVYELTVKQWAFDVELLYLCKKRAFTIKEIPTVWNDQADSKLHVMRSGMRMISSIIKLKLAHMK